VDAVHRVNRSGGTCLRANQGKLCGRGRRVDVHRYTVDGRRLWGADQRSFRHSGESRNPV